MQKNIIIKSKDRKVNIYGVLDNIASTRKLIIFVHGLTGHKNEHHLYNGAKFFNSKGFNTFRFDLYSEENKGRRLKNCSIKTHSIDLETVINHFKNIYKDIFLVGHSLGGPTILGANLVNVNKIVLWDPSTILVKEDKSWFNFDKRINAYIIDWGVSIIANKQLFDEWMNLDYTAWYKNCTQPLKIVCAEKGIVQHEWKKILHNFKNKHELRIVKKAGHCFDEEDTEIKLFEETLAWFI